MFNELLTAIHLETRYHAYYRTARWGSRITRAQWLALQIMADERLEDSTMNSAEITVQWEGPGHYWFTNGDGQLDLGECETEDQARMEAVRAIRAGSGDEDWSDWYISQ